jgi:hypothetical protein
MHFLVSHLWYDAASLEEFGITPMKVLFVLKEMYLSTSAGNGPREVNNAWLQIAAISAAANFECFGSGLVGNRQFRWSHRQEGKMPPQKFRSIESFAVTQHAVEGKCYEAKHGADFGFVGDQNGKQSSSDVVVLAIRRSAMKKPEVLTAISSILFASHYAKMGVQGFSFFPIVAGIVQDRFFSNIYLHGIRIRIRDVLSPYIEECGDCIQRLLHGLFKNLFAFAKTGFMLTSLCLVK